MHHQKYFSRHKKVDGPPISCRVQLIILSFSFSAAWSNLTNTQGTDVDGRCPLLSNSAQTPPISHFTTFEWSLQQFHTALHRVRGPLHCTEVVPSVSPSLRVWNGHKVTISPSVGDSDGSIRRLLKSKNATKTFYLLFYCIMGEYSFILKCLYLEAIQTRWNKMLLDTNGNIRLWCTVSRLQVQIQFCTVLVFLCWSATSLSLSLWVICKVFPMLGESGFWRRWRITIARKHHFQLSRTFIAFDLQHIALMLMMMMMI